MTTISTDHARHSTSTEVASRLAMGGDIRAADAAAIASWYQTPGGHGATFAAFASGCEVDSADLIDAAIREIDADPDADQRAELVALCDWVDRQVSANG